MLSRVSRHLKHSFCRTSTTGRLTFTVRTPDFPTDTKYHRIRKRRKILADRQNPPGLDQNTGRCEKRYNDRSYRESSQHVLQLRKSLTTTLVDVWVSLLFVQRVKNFVSPKSSQITIKMCPILVPQINLPTALNGHPSLQFTNHCGIVYQSSVRVAGQWPRCNETYCFSTRLRNPFQCSVLDNETFHRRFQLTKSHFGDY